jgi:hypothetical protein
MASGGRLVRKNELLDAVWPGVIVGDAALQACIGEIRKALGDNAGKPRFIKTVHRKGYRFIGAIGANNTQSTAQLHPASEQPVLLGRKQAIQQLHAIFDQACHAKRQLVFVTGEPGIGKTAMVRAFSTALADQTWIGTGQCVDHCGSAEPYLPVLDTLSKLCRGVQGDKLTALLAWHAPTLLLQLPRVLDATQIGALRNKIGTMPGADLSAEQIAFIHDKTYRRAFADKYRDRPD